MSVSRPARVFSPIRIAIAIGITMVAVGIVATAVYYIYTSTTAQRPIVVPTGSPLHPPVPVGETRSIYFLNNRNEDVWVIPTYGTITDTHVPRWTDWQGTTGAASGVYNVPHTETLVPLMIPAGGTASMTVYIAGMPSVRFGIRTGCEPTTMICKTGDDKFVYGVDGLENTPEGRLRDQTSAGPVPFKPAINTLVEMTWGCSYTDNRNCAVNPSCITDPGACEGMQGFMDSRPTGAKWHTDGLLYEADGVTNIKPPYKNGNSGAAVGVLASPAYFNISCVDGITVPIELQVRRPSNIPPNHTETLCHTTIATDAIDDPNNTDWQRVAYTTALAGAIGCPTEEIVWPSTLHTVAQVLPHVGDGYNDNYSQEQYMMPWLTEGMGRTPAGPTVKLTSAFVPGATVDLNFYRDPKEVAALLTKNFPASKDDKIGCASTCAALTQDRGHSMMYPKPDGHVFPTGTYIVGTNVLVTTDRGVSDICCIAGASGTTVATDGDLKCNTSTWWVGGGTTGPIQPDDHIANYAFGFYANVYAPPPGSHWYEAGVDGPESKNPYAGGPNASAYVNAVRQGETGQRTTTRAYSYQYDDPYVLMNCEIDKNPNTNHSARGEFFSNYEVKIIIHA